MTDSRAGSSAFLIFPIDSVSDHVEVLYDVVDVGLSVIV